VYTCHVAVVPLTSLKEQAAKRQLCWRVCTTVVWFWEIRVHFGIVFWGWGWSSWMPAASSFMVTRRLTVHVVRQLSRRTKLDDVPWNFWYRLIPLIIHFSELWQAIHKCKVMYTSSIYMLNCRSTFIFASRCSSDCYHMNSEAPSPCVMGFL
jgi:hypothetical protein